MIGLPDRDGFSVFPTQHIGLHRAVAFRGSKGQQLIYQDAEAMPLSGSKIDRVSHAIGEARITLSHRKGKETEGPVKGLETLQASDNALSYDKFDHAIRANAHTYRAADVMKDEATMRRVFEHYDAYEMLEHLAAQVKAPKHPKYVHVERTRNGRKFKFVTYDYGVDHELRQGTPYADSPSFFKRRYGQMLQRFRELGQGVLQSMRDPLDTGRTGGRVIFTSALLNVFVLALVASLGLYELHKNDEQAKKILQEN